MGFGSATPGVRAQTCAGGRFSGCGRCRNPSPGARAGGLFPRSARPRCRNPYARPRRAAFAPGVAASPHGRGRGTDGKPYGEGIYTPTPRAWPCLRLPKFCGLAIRAWPPGPGPGAQPCGRRARRGRGRRAGTRQAMRSGERAGPVPAQGGAWFVSAGEAPRLGAVFRPGWQGRRAPVDAGRRFAGAAARKRFQATCRLGLGRDRRPLPGVMAPRPWIFPGSLRKSRLGWNSLLTLIFNFN
jgi:hypothetical protein